MNKSKTKPSETKAATTDDLPRMAIHPLTAIPVRTPARRWRYLVNWIDIFNAIHAGHAVSLAMSEDDVDAALGIAADLAKEESWQIPAVLYDADAGRLWLWDRETVLWRFIETDELRPNRQRRLEPNPKEQPPQKLNIDQRMVGVFPPDILEPQHRPTVKAKPWFYEADWDDSKAIEHLDEGRVVAFTAAPDEVGSAVACACFWFPGDVLAKYDEATHRLFLQEAAKQG